MLMLGCSICCLAMHGVCLDARGWAGSQKGIANKLRAVLVGGGGEGFVHTTQKKLAMTVGFTAFYVFAPACIPTFFCLLPLLMLMLYYSISYSVAYHS